MDKRKLRSMIKIIRQMKVICECKSDEFTKISN